MGMRRGCGVVAVELVKQPQLPGVGPAGATTHMQTAGGRNARKGPSRAYLELNIAGGRECGQGGWSGCRPTGANR